MVLNRRRVTHPRNWARSHPHNSQPSSPESLGLDLTAREQGRKEDLHLFQLQVWMVVKVWESCLPPALGGPTLSLLAALAMDLILEGLLLQDRVKPPLGSHGLVVTHP